MLYEVTIKTPSVNKTIYTEANSSYQAKLFAVAETLSIESQNGPLPSPSSFARECFESAVVTEIPFENA